MDFELSEEQQMFRDVLRKFVDEEIRPVARDMEQSGQYPTEIVAKMADLGLFGITVDAEYGGLRPRHRVDEPGVRGDLDGLDGHRRHPRQPLAELPDDHQPRHRRAEAALAARAGPPASAAPPSRSPSPGAGSDLQGISTRAWRDGDTYVIRGTKTWITNARFANPLPVLVKTDPDAEPRHRG